jgi:TrmH family RNA methyltransferase
VPRELLDSALATETPQPMAALVEPPEWTWDHLLGGERSRLDWPAAPLVVLAGLQDPGNLGDDSALRRGLRRHGVLSLPGTVSAWNPKAVRASAGSSSGFRCSPARKIALPACERPA